MRLNVEEMNFLAALDTATKDAVVQDILSSLPYFESKELEEIAERVLLKLDAMSEAEFTALDIEIYKEDRSHE
ncbi:MAG: transposon-transfer assisting family protein [Eubacteriales bacterium]|nr:transposon-transfer assisting family protein [Eubacteriales bacterium]